MKMLQNGFREISVDLEIFRLFLLLQFRGLNFDFTLSFRAMLQLRFSIFSALSISEEKCEGGRAHVTLLLHLPLLNTVIWKRGQFSFVLSETTV